MRVNTAASPAVIMGSQVQASAAPRPEPARDSRILADIKHLVADGALAEARDLFAELVAQHQRRASRIAYHYLRDTAEADEAVQDAFVKVFAHVGSYREELPFEVWFTRILINGCLDRHKARSRRERWIVPTLDVDTHHREWLDRAATPTPSPEETLIRRERREWVTDAIGRLPPRQRTVSILCLYGDYTPREVSEMTGMNESTIRVHLFRAIRKLRGLLEQSRDAS